jgi:hypothetical protein
VVDDDDMLDTSDVVRNDDVVDALRDVEQAVNQVQKAVEEKWSLAQSIGVLVFAFFAWSVVKDIWYAKWRLGLSYNVSADKIYVDKSPHDCNFFAAPIGEKYCHYDRELMTLRWATSTNGDPIVSYNEGKTWSVFTPDAGVSIPKSPTVQEVYVSWKKVEE